MKPKPLGPKTIRRLLARIDAEIVAMHESIRPKLTRLADERAAILARCDHSDTERHYDPSGNCDSYDECRICRSIVK